MPGSRAGRRGHLSAIPGRSSSSVGQQSSASLPVCWRGVHDALDQSPAPMAEWPALQEVLGPELLAGLVGVSASSTRRYASGARATPDPIAVRLHFVALVVGDLAGAYNDIGVRRWFQRPRTRLDGNTPARAARRGVVARRRWAQSGCESLRPALHPRQQRDRLSPCGPSLRLPAGGPSPIPVGRWNTEGELTHYLLRHTGRRMGGVSPARGNRGRGRPPWHTARPLGRRDRRRTGHPSRTATPNPRGRTLCLARVPT